MRIKVHGDDAGKDEGQGEGEIADVGSFAYAPPLQEFGAMLIRSMRNRSRRCKGNRIISTFKSCNSKKSFLTIRLVYDKTKKKKRQLRISTDLQYSGRCIHGPICTCMRTVM